MIFFFSFPSPRSGTRLREKPRLLANDWNTEFFGSPDLEVKLTYSGQFKNGKAHGQGTVSYIITTVIPGDKLVSEWKYEGQFKDGKADGQGIVSGNSLKTPAVVQTIGNYFK